MDKIFKFLWGSWSFLSSLLMIAYGVQMVKEIWICIREIYEHYMPPSEDTLKKRELKIRRKMKKLLDDAEIVTRKRRDRMSRRKDKAINRLLGPNFKV